MVGSTTPTRLRLPVEGEFGYSDAVDINENGVIATYVGDGDGNLQSYLWREGRLQPLNVPERLGSPLVEALNDHGAAVGLGYKDLEWTPVVWRQGRASVLPVPGRFVLGRAFDVNNHGLVVGSAQTLAGVSHPYAWWPSGRSGMLPLPDHFRARTFVEATDVDDRGHIYGYESERGRILVWTERGLAVHVLPRVSPQSPSYVSGSDDSGTVVGRLTTQRTEEPGPLLQRSSGRARREPCCR